MGFNFPPGKYPKYIIKQNLYRLRIDKGNTTEFFAMLMKAGYIEMKGNKMVLIKKPIRF